MSPCDREGTSRTIGNSDPGRLRRTTGTRDRSADPRAGVLCWRSAGRAPPVAVDLFADDGISDARRGAGPQASTWLAGRRYATAFCRPPVSSRHIGDAPTFEPERRRMLASVLFEPWP